MRDTRLEALLLAARVLQEGDHSPFTQSVMQQIKAHAFMGRALAKQKPGTWSRLLRQARLHKVLAGHCGGYHPGSFKL